MFSILTLIGYLFIALLLMNMMAKARPRVKDPMPGKKLKTLPMDFASRFRLQRSSLLALLMGVVFGTATGWLPVSTAGIVAALAIITILLPMQYTFTTKGVGLGDGIFYLWKDFSGYVAKEKGLELSHPSLLRQRTLFLKPAEMTKVLQYVEQYVKKDRADI